MVEPISISIAIIVVSSVSGSAVAALILSRFILWIKEVICKAIYDEIRVMRQEQRRLFDAILIAITRKCEGLSKKSIITIEDNRPEIYYAPPIGEYLDMDDFYIAPISENHADVDGFCLSFRRKNTEKVREFLQCVLPIMRADRG